MASTKSQPILTLYRGWADRGKYVWSPFVTKLEFRLRHSNISYTCAAGSPSSGPKGKIPYIQLGDEAVGDTSLILKQLIDLDIVSDVNAKLTPAQRGQDLAMRALLEDKLYFYQGHERWVKNYYAMRDHTLGSIPYPLRVIIGLLAYRGNVRKLHDQGAGRFSDAEILAFKTEIWEGVSAVLEGSRRKKKPGNGECWWLLGGEEPTEADASLFGFVVSVLVCDAGPESRELLRSRFKGVVGWAEQVHEHLFPDYEMWE